MEILSYSYRSKPRIVLLTCVFFGGGALFMRHKAMVNDRGLVINGLIHLEPKGATTFFWCVAAICAAFVAIGVSAFFAGLLFSHRVVLTSSDVSAPRFPFSRKATVVKLSEIKGLSVHSIRDFRFLDIHHLHGKLRITSAFLPDEAAFDKLRSAILKHVRALTTQPATAASLNR